MSLRIPSVALRFAIAFGCLAFGLQSNDLRATDLVSLRSPKPDGTPLAISAWLEVGGYLTVVADKSGKQPEPVPMSVVAQFSYDEQRLDDGSDLAHRLALRKYEDSQATIKIASKVTKPRLRDARKLISAATAKTSVVLSSPTGPLTRDELDLIDIPANTLVLDKILPQADVPIGHHWKPSDDVMPKFLCLDAVGHTEVECILVDAKNGVGEVTLDGSLGGAIDGISTEIELKGKLLVDIARGQAKSLLLAIKEKRGVSHVDPGVDVVAKLKLSISPLVESKLLTADLISQTKLPQSVEAPPLEYISLAKGYSFQYDRRWHITREDPTLLVMRFIDRGDLVAQCNLAPASQAADKPEELSQFQSEVQDALGKLFSRFEKASERGTESGLRILESIVAGAAQDLPIQWRYYMVHDRQGRALSVVFTMEAPLADQFRDQDTPIIESVQFMEPKIAAINSPEPK